MTYLYHKTKIVIPGHKRDEITDYFQRACGGQNHAFNWALRAWKKDPSKSHTQLRNEYNKVRKVEFPWTYEVTKWACQRGFENFGIAVKNHKKNPSHFGVPKSKKPHSGRRSFYIGADTLVIRGKYINIPHLGTVKMSEPVRFKGRCMSVTISRQSDGNWYASVLVEVNDLDYKHKCTTSEAVGIDVGFNTFATLSTGEKLKLPKPYRVYERKLARLQQAFSRNVYLSKNWYKAKDRVGVVHTKIANIRNHHLHNLTARLVRDYRYIAVEGIDFHAMAQSLNFGKSIGDAGFGEVRRQLEYKTQLAGGFVITADKWYASSKLCSHCGCKNELLTLDMRSWTCQNCGVPHDRDINAAINLRKLALEYRERLNACGDDVITYSGSQEPGTLHESAAGYLSSAMRVTI